MNICLVVLAHLLWAESRLERTLQLALSACFVSVLSCFVSVQNFRENSHRLHNGTMSRSTRSSTNRRQVLTPPSSVLTRNEDTGSSVSGLSTPNTRRSSRQVNAASVGLLQLSTETTATSTEHNDPSAEDEEKNLEQQLYDDVSDRSSEDEYEELEVEPNEFNKEGSKIAVIGEDSSVMPSGD